MKLIRTVTSGGSVGFFVGMIPELQNAGYEVVSISSDAPQLQLVRDAGARTIVLQMQRHISPLKDLKSLWQMIKVLRRERPDMIHSMTPKAGLLSMLAGKITGVPIRIHTFTGLIFPTSTGLKRKILLAADKLTCACATHIIPEGEGVKRDLINNNVTKKPLQMLGYGNVRGINVERFNPNLEELKEQAAKIRKDGIFTFITVGRIVGDKGINELVRAFCRLNKEIPQTRLILVGKTEPQLDPLKEETTKIIDSVDSIEAVGQQKDVRPWLMAADCAVLASYREGFPNVVIEAGAMGLPQIVTDINGANEIIIEGQNGTLVPPKNVDVLYNAMKKMISDRHWREWLAENARGLITSRYEQSYVRECLYDYYRKVVCGE